MPSVGKPIPHDSAIVGYVTGTAWYIDDLPLCADELFVVLPAALWRAGGLTRSIFPQQKHFRATWQF